MSYPVFTKETSIRYPQHTKELDTPIQTYVPTAKKKKNKHQKTTFLPNEEKLRAAKGIICGLIICIPFWILIIKFFVWLI